MRTWPVILLSCFCINFSSFATAETYQVIRHASLFDPQERRTSVDVAIGQILESDDQQTAEFRNVTFQGKPYYIAHWAIQPLDKAIVLWKEKLAGTPSAAYKTRYAAALANALLQSGDRDAAILAANDLSVAGTDAFAQAVLGLTQLAPKEAATATNVAATTTLASAVSLNREDTNSLLNLGVAQWSRGDFDSAEIIFREASRLRPDWEAAKTNWANTLLMRAIVEKDDTKSRELAAEAKSRVAGISSSSAMHCSALASYLISTTPAEVDASVEEFQKLGGTDEAKLNLAWMQIMHPTNPAFVDQTFRAIDLDPIKGYEIWKNRIQVGRELTKPDGKPLDELCKSYPLGWLEESTKRSLSKFIAPATGTGPLPAPP